MGVGYDYTSSILLCPEDNNSILGFDDFDENDGNGELGTNGEVGERGEGLISEERCDFYGDSLMGFPLQSEENLVLMVERETEHLPRSDYAKRLMDGDLDLSVRRDAIDWIGKVHAHYSFGPLTAYLSINYLDRFLSVYKLPQGKAWMTQLLSVACLSLAAKMEETEVPLSLDLQVGEAKYVFEARTIQRMELLVLSTLKWRMQAVTPFSFIDYFIDKFNNGSSFMKLLISRSTELILSSIRGIDLLEFKPSEIAAAVALVSLRETQVVETEKALSCCIYIEKERVFRCCEVIQEIASAKSNPPKAANPSASSVPRSPIGVLDAASFSYKSDEATTTVGSLPNSENTSPAAKRRKLSKPS